MKKVLGLILGCFLVASTAHATGAVDAREESLKISGDVISATDLTLAAGTVYSDGIDITKSQGFGILLATADASGDIDISAEYSLDGSNWYVAYEAADPMDGTLTADGLIVEGLSNATRYIVFPLRLGNQIRFKLDPDANTTLTASMIWLR